MIDASEGFLAIEKVFDQKLTLSKLVFAKIVFSKIDLVIYSSQKSGHARGAQSLLLSLEQTSGVLLYLVWDR